jgi:hypothetical protein
LHFDLYQLLLSQRGSSRSAQQYEIHFKTESH